MVPFRDHGLYGISIRPQQQYYRMSIRLLLYDNELLSSNELLLYGYDLLHSNELLLYGYDLLYTNELLLYLWTPIDSACSRPRYTTVGHSNTTTTVCQTAACQ